MATAKRLGSFVGLILVFGMLMHSVVLGASEITTPNSPFTVGSSTAATVTSYSPLIGDNGQYPSTTASIYNLFGATNSSVENSGDIIFGDKNSQPNTVSFTTPTPVLLDGLAVYLNSDDGNLNGPRSVGTFTFVADGTEILNTSPVNEAVASNGGLNIFMFPHPVTAESFVATFSANPNLDFTPDSNNDGVGPRVYELDGIVPEPASLGILSIGLLSLLRRRRSDYQSMTSLGFVS